MLKIKEKIRKYIPSPKQADKIISFFVHNNYQDFNTWQQIAKSKTQFTFTEMQGYYICKAILKWDNKNIPYIVQQSTSKTKKKAKRKTLRKIIQNIVYNGYIGMGFKQQNFINKIPKRRNDQSQSSDEQNNQNNIIIINSIEMFQDIFNYNFSNNIIALFIFALNRQDNLNCKRILEKITGQTIDNNQITTESIRLQHSNLSKQSNHFKRLPQDSLTNFTNYNLLQERLLSITHQPLNPPQNSTTIYPIPSQQFCKHHESTVERISSFYPLEAKQTIIQNKPKKVNDYYVLNEKFTQPNFQLFSFQISLILVDQLFDCLLYYVRNIEFVLEILANFQVLYKAKIHWNKEFIDYRKQEQYIRRRIDLTRSELLTIDNKLRGKCDREVQLQGMIRQIKNKGILNGLLFEIKQNFIYKIDRKFNTNEFQEMVDLNSQELILLRSKFNRQEEYIGYIEQYSNIIKVKLTNFNQNWDIQPLQIQKIHNIKIYNKIAKSIRKSIKSNINFHLIWQPSITLYNMIIFDLLAQWLTLGESILIVTSYPDQSQVQLLLAGFKCIKVSLHFQQRKIDNNTVVISNPIHVCCDGLKNYAFTRVLIDEAHHIPQLQSLLAFEKGCQKAWLIGDPYLPSKQYPYDKSSFSTRNRSLFERLLSEGNKLQTYISTIQKICIDLLISEWAINRYYKKIIQQYKQLHKKSIIEQNKRMNEQISIQKIQQMDYLYPLRQIIKGFHWPSQQYRICLINQEYNQQYTQYQHRFYSCDLIHCIVKQVIQSGYTKWQQISIQFSNKQYYQLYYNQFNWIQSNYKNKILKVCDGSRFHKNDLCLFIVDWSCNTSILIAMLMQGLRGIIMLGNFQLLASNSPEWNDFIRWAIDKKIIVQVKNQCVFPFDHIN